MLFGFTCNREWEMPEYRYALSTAYWVLLLLLIPAPSFFQEKTESYRHFWCWIHLHKSTLSFEPYFGLWQSPAELNPLKKKHGIHTNSSLLYHVLHQVHFVIETLFCRSCNPRHLVAISLYSLSWAELSGLGRVCPLEEKQPTDFLCVCVAGVETNDVQPHWDSWPEGKGSINEKDERLLVPDHSFSILRDCQIFHFQLGSVF